MVSNERPVVLIIWEHNSAKATPAPLSSHFISDDADAPWRVLLFSATETLLFATNPQNYSFRDWGALLAPLGLPGAPRARAFGAGPRPDAVARRGEQAQT